MENYYIKTNRSFSVIRKYGWLFTILVAIGGLWEPKLGILVIFVMAGLTATSFFKGRFWCGNICPHGSLFDNLIHPISRNKKIPSILKSKPMIAGFFVFFMYNFTNRIFSAAEAWGTANFLDRVGMVFSRTYLVVLIIGGALAIVTNPRSWCQFCPMGSLEKMSYKLGTKFNLNKSTDQKLTIDAQEKCHQCGKCARVCPFQLEPYTNFSDNNQYDDVNCIRCGTCVENCPAGILSFKNQREALYLKHSVDLEGYKDRIAITAEIKDIIKLAPDINEYVFRFVEPKEVSYKAGQYILLKLKGLEKMYRAYSIASYDFDHRSLRVIIKKVPKGFGTEKIFNEYKIGDLIELEGPMGEELVLREKGKHLFIGNGIGMTPFIGLVEEALKKGSEMEHAIFVHGQRTEENFLYNETFLQYAKNQQKFDYYPVASRPKEKNTRKGYVMDVIKELDIKEYHVYICGSPKMIYDTVNLLLEKGVSLKNIRYESEEKIKNIDQGKTVTKSA